MLCIIKKSIIHHIAQYLPIMIPHACKIWILCDKRNVMYDLHVITFLLMFPPGFYSNIGPGPNRLPLHELQRLVHMTYLEQLQTLPAVHQTISDTAQMVQLYLTTIHGIPAPVRYWINSIFYKGWYWFIWVDMCAYIRVIIAAAKVMRNVSLQ